MEKIRYYESLKAELDWLATSYFETNEELDQYYRELDAVNQILIELKGGAQI